MLESDYLPLKGLVSTTKVSVIARRKDLAH